MCLCGVAVACPARLLSRMQCAKTNEENSLLLRLTTTPPTRTLRSIHTHAIPSFVAATLRGNMCTTIAARLGHFFPHTSSSGKTGHNFIRLFVRRPRRTKKCNKSQSTGWRWVDFRANTMRAIVGKRDFGIVVHSHTRAQNPTDFVWKKDTAGILCYGTRTTAAPFT